MNDSEDRQALIDMAREFTEGFNSGDVDRIMKFYSDRYVDINLRSPIQTHAERREYYLSVIRRGGIRLSVHPDDILILGENAIVRGHIDITRLSDNTVTELRYMEFAVKRPDGWKAVWGMDGPVQEYTPPTSG